MSYGNLIYVPKTGQFFRLTSDGQAEPAGYDNGEYWCIQVDSKTHRAHRLAFILMGKDLADDMQVDHINGYKYDNRWENLRPATQFQNRQNAKLKKNNKTGFKCVHKQGNRYKATITYNGKKEYLGLFLTAEEANEVAKDARRKHHQEFARDF